MTFGGMPGSAHPAVGVGAESVDQHLPHDDVRHQAMAVDELDHRLCFLIRFGFVAVTDPSPRRRRR